MYYYYGNNYKEAMANKPVKIDSTKVLEQYKEIYNEVIPAKEFLVMYWNDMDDYPVAVFDVIAPDESDAEEAAIAAGGDQYDNWPVLIEEKDDWLEQIDNWKKEAEIGGRGRCELYKEVR